MIVDGTFQLKGDLVVDGHSDWDDNLSHKVGDILNCGSKQWEVIAVDRIFQGCFGRPSVRHHTLKLKPIGHSDMPIIGDVLIK
jgi:hypothetical protein